MGSGLDAQNLVDLWGYNTNQNLGITRFSSVHRTCRGEYGSVSSNYHETHSHLHLKPEMTKCLDLIFETNSAAST